MEKVINIDGRDVRFKATAATIRSYRQNFGQDLLQDMQSLQAETASGATLSVNALNIFENIAYTMAKQADPSIPATADEWLDTFGMFSIYVVLPQIIELWQLSTISTAEVDSKNAKTEEGEP